MENKELFGRNIKPGNIVVSSLNRRELNFGIVLKITTFNVRIWYFVRSYLKTSNINSSLKRNLGALAKNCVLIQDESKYFSKEELEVINHLRKDL